MTRRTKQARIKDRVIGFTSSMTTTSHSQPVDQHASDSGAYIQKNEHEHDREQTNTHLLCRYCKYCKAPIYWATEVEKAFLLPNGWPKICVEGLYK